MTQGGRGFDVVDGLGGSRHIVPLDLLIPLTQRSLASVRPDAIRLGPDRIEWRSNPTHWLPGASGSECLFNFLALADEPDPQAFLEFAQKHGVLGLTEDLLPGFFQQKECPRVPDDPDWVFEPIEAWRAYARNAKMLLVLALALREGRPIDPVAVLQSAGLSPQLSIPGERLSDRAMVLSATTRLVQSMFSALELGAAAPDVSKQQQTAVDDLLKALQAIEERTPLDQESQVLHVLGNDYKLHALSNGDTWLPLMCRVPDVRLQRVSLTRGLDTQWLSVANVRPTVQWLTGPAQLVLKLHRDEPLEFQQVESGVSVRTRDLWPENPLFSVIAVELAGIICSDRHVGRCWRCSRLHSAKNKVRIDQPNYCDSCRLAVRRATNRDAARRRYAREKAKPPTN